MRQHHNVLYVTTPDAWLHKRDASVEVCREGQAPVRIPLHHLQAIACLGPVGVSPYLMAACVEEGIAVTFLSEHGKFLALVQGPQQGNVLLRRAQYRAADDPGRCIAIARNMVLGKLANCRTLLRRGGRESDDQEARTRFDDASNAITGLIDRVRATVDTDTLRGLEGAGAVAYFGCFNDLLRGDDTFRWTRRSRRPPLDPVNSILSFAYSLLLTDCGSAAQSVGLDPQVGFLHVDKSGRPALALDLMEELRPVLADRLLLALVNRKQLREEHFRREEPGAVLLTPEGRRVVLTHYQERKREEVRHPLTDERTSYALVPHLQARLLARHLRGDLDAYPPFLAS